MANYSKYYMRKILFAILLAAISFGAMAQNAKNSINIDPSSFRPVQTDVLTGVNIDPIAKDRSQRECARIKLHVNRMTREEIDQLQVHIVGGMVALTKKVIAYEGNGLILEMTAKPQTRFYLHHDKYGDSNEVMVNLEGNKEYFLDAQLDMLLPITVVSNIKGADVYVDGTYKGQTNDNYMLTVEDIVPGAHKIALKYGAATTEKLVDVNSSNISFRVEINSQSSQPQYVVFDLEPKTAIVFIDNEPQTTQDGVMSTVLQNGTYSYRVIAKGYYEQTGSFSIEGAKVVRKITLKADAAMVTISAAGEDVEIWANNELKGKSPWRGPLIAGTYIFEARKAGHRTTTLSQAITSTPAEQSYTLNAPTPIIGSVDITSTPALADVYIDGKHVGQTPMMSNLLEGKHTISIQKMGYAISEHSATVLEGKTTTVVAMLNKATSVGEILQDSNNNTAVNNTIPATNTTNTSNFSDDIEKRTIRYTTTDGKIASGKSPFKDGSFPLLKLAESHTCGKIVLKPNVTEFPSMLFYDWEKMVSIDIPENIKKLGVFTFLGCDNLKNIYCRSKTPPQVDDHNYLYDYTIYVPNDAVETYRHSEDWKDCKITGFDFSSISGSTYTSNAAQATTETNVANNTPKPENKEGKIVRDYYKRYGYKDEKGVLVLNYDYKQMRVADNHIFARIDKKDTWGMYDLKGNLILPHIYGGIRNYETEGLRAVRKDGKWGYIDNKGNTAIDFKYRDAQPFSEGLAAVKKGRYGYIDKEGKVVIPFKHKTADKFHNGMARVGKQAGWGWLAYCIYPPLVWLTILNMSYDMKYGYIDKSGSMVIPKKYKGAPLRFDRNGLAEVYKNKSHKKFYIDKNNNPYKTYEEALLKTSGKK